MLFKALREATDLPIHFHTHDTSGIAAATVLAAVDAGVDVVDAAMDAFSGNTSQPCLGSIVEALRGSERDPGLDPEWIRRISFYWEAVRNQYAAFESDLKGPASEVYLHEMPGGQFTNLKEQARSLGLETRWHQVAQAYADANQMFGDIVKVTPSSKVVGDMALMMVSQDLTVADVENPAKDVVLPGIGRLDAEGRSRPAAGRMAEGAAEEGAEGRKGLYGASGLAACRMPISMPSARTIETKLERKVSDFEFASYLMYPKVFTDYALAADTYGPVCVLPTPAYFYGLTAGEELLPELEKGVSLVILHQAKSEPDEQAMVKVFFELNGQPRLIKVPDRNRAASSAARRKADLGNAAHLGAPMPGVISTVAVTAGQTVKSGDVLLSIEAMKMETALHAEKDGTIAEVLVRTGDQIDAKDLLLVIEG